MFILESSLTGAGTVITNRILVKDGEAVANGEALVAAAGRLTKCGAAGIPQFVAAQTVTAGTNNQIDYIVVRKDQTFLADVTGDINLIAAAVGAKTACIDATGLNLDAGALTGGNVEIVSADVTRNKARVRFNL